MDIFVQNFRKGIVWKPINNFYHKCDEIRWRRSTIQSPLCPKKGKKQCFKGKFRPCWRAVVTVFHQICDKNCLLASRQEPPLKFCTKIYIKTLEKANFLISGHFLYIKDPKMYRNRWCLGHQVKHLHMAWNFFSRFNSWNDSIKNGGARFDVFLKKVGQTNHPTRPPSRLDW